MQLEETIYIVDDDTVVCNVIGRILEAHGLKVERYNDARSFLTACESASPDCVLLDMDLPDMSGLQVQEVLRRLRPNTPVIFVSGTTSVREAIDGMKGGAIDLLQKPARPSELVNAVSAALTSARTRCRERVYRDQAKARIDLLTARERQVLEQLIGGASNKATGAALHISERTVEVHRSRILRKLNVGNVTEAVRLALLAEPQLLGRGR